MIRVNIRDSGGIDHHLLQAAIAKKMAASSSGWSDVANGNLLSSVAGLKKGGPSWACQGPRFWGAIETGTHEDADFFVGLRVGHDAARPPEVRELARHGPSVIVAIVKEYTPFFRWKPVIIVEMMAPGGDTEMRLGTIPQWKELLLEPAVLTSPLAVFAASVGAGLTFYSRTGKFAEAAFVFGVGCALAVLSWLAASRMAARRAKPRWEREGWEIT